MRHLIVLAFLFPTSAWALGESYVEGSVSFTGAGLDLSATPFRLTSGPSGAAAALTPFGEAPFDGALALGTRVDARVVLKGVRVGVGYGVPTTGFRMAETRVTTELPAGTATSIARGLETRELRLALGGEAFFGDGRPSALYLDLVGRHVWADADLSLDGEPARYRGHGFGYALAGGAKVGFAKFAFIEAGAEVGLVGPTTWSAHLGVGVALGDWM